MAPVTVRKLTREQWDVANQPAPKPLTIVEAARQELARRLGLRTSALRTINPRHELLLKAGAKVDLHISRERFEVQLTLDDLGITPANDAEAKALETLIVLGRRRTLPDRWPSAPEDAKHGPIMDLDAVDDQARYFLTKSSHRTHWGWFVAEGNAECGHCGWLEPGTMLVDHLQAEHPAEHGKFTTLLGTVLVQHGISAKGIEDGIDQLIEKNEAAYSALMDRYPMEVGNTESETRTGRERGWHWRAVIRKLNEFATAYEAVGQRIVDEYPELMRAVRRDTTILAFQVYERMRDQAVRRGEVALAQFNEQYGDVETFIHDFVLRALGDPEHDEKRRERIAKSFEFSIETGHIPLSNELELDKLKAARMRAERAVAEADERVASAAVAERVRVETAQDRIAAETLEAEARVLAAQTAARVKAAEQVEQELAKERRARQSEMERAIEKQAQKRLETEVFGFIDDVRANVRSTVYETVVDALATLRGDKGKLSAGSVRGVRGLLDTVRQLDFAGEPGGLREKIAELRGLLDVAAKDRDERLIGARLTDLAAESRLILMDLNRPPKRSAAEFGIPDGADDLVVLLAGPQRHEAAAPISTEPLVVVPERRAVRREALAI